MSDVCLILEGTFPYVTGGVSSCVYQLIEETPQLTYSIVYIGAKKEIDHTYKYPIPKNVRLIKEIFLFDHFQSEDSMPKKIGISPAQKKMLKSSILFGGESNIEDIYKHFFDPNTRLHDPDELFKSKEVWDILELEYKKSFTRFNAPSFIDFFYTWRFSNYPIFKVLSTDIPKATIYHTMCTGYAGLLGCVAKLKFNCPLILTEHGIYTHERKIEISQSDWLYTNEEDIAAQKQLSYFKNWWMNKFISLGSMTYKYADEITTLYNGNQLKQVQLGADNNKITIIPNGINNQKLIKNVEKANIYAKKKKVTIALVGRVVPIKDIKTFIKAISFLIHHFQDFEVLILGPVDEDESYYEECQTLVKLLDLTEVINFCGKVDLRYYYPSIDMLILSSISEGQPLVMLEAYSFNIPVIATDVGSCSELIHGRTAEDKALGSTGFTLPFGMSQLLGEKMLELCKDEELRKTMGQIAFTRYELYYQEKYSIKNYLKIYHQHLNYTL